MKTIHKIVPDVSLFGKLGARSRALPMVATELVDNSLDSWLTMPTSEKKNKTLKVEVSARSARGSWFIVRDNAGGMDAGELAHAMTVAHSAKDGAKQLGHFGFGLKSAAMYIGPKFRIFTRSYKDPKKVHFVEFDRAKFEAEKEWEIEIQTMALNEASKLDIHFSDGHGTEIWIVNDRFKSALEKGIVRRLRKTFAPRLPVAGKSGKNSPYHSADMMEIIFNEHSLRAQGPFYEVWQKPDGATAERGAGKQEDSALMPGNAVVEIAKIRINGNWVWGRAGILDRGMAHNNQYGFDLIKHFRVIELNALDRSVDDKRIGLVASNHNARIVGQLFLDGWETDHQKTEFIKDSDDWTLIAEHVSKAIKPLLKVSSNLQYNKEREKAKQSAAEQLATKKARDSTPELNKGVQRAARSGGIKKTLSEIESRHNKEEKRAKAAPPTKPKPTVSNTRLLATKPVTDYEHNDAKGPLLRSRPISDGSGDRLKVMINLDHPFLKDRGSAELTAIGEFLAVDAFSEYILKNRNLLSHEDFLELRDRFLKELRGTG